MTEIQTISVGSMMMPLTTTFRRPPGVDPILTITPIDVSKEIPVSAGLGMISIATPRYQRSYVKTFQEVSLHYSTLEGLG